jgi:signal transduction histidine kinase
MGKRKRRFCIFKSRSAEINPVTTNSRTVIPSDHSHEHKAQSPKEEIAELKKLETFRKEFLGNVSHELKTPIFNIQVTSIRSLTEP